MPSNNPLQQYFRQPAIYIKLPSNGDFYPDGAIDMPPNREIPVYPMTAIDEITYRTPDALFNGSATTNVIKSCVPNILDPWSIPATDLDSILTGIRAATNGSEIELESACPNCKEITGYSINLIQLLSTIDPSGYEKLLKVGELSFKFKPLSYKEINQSNMFQFELQREIDSVNTIEDISQRTNKSNSIMKKLTEMNIALVADTIESITTPNTTVDDRKFIQEYLRGCDKNTYEEIRQHVINIREAVNIKPLTMQCSGCEIGRAHV